MDSKDENETQKHVTNTTADQNAEPVNDLAESVETSKLIEEESKMSHEPLITTGILNEQDAEAVNDLAEPVETSNLIDEAFKVSPQQEINTATKVQQSEDNEIVNNESMEAAVSPAIPKEQQEQVEGNAKQGAHTVESEPMGQQAQSEETHCKEYAKQQEQKVESIPMEQEVQSENNAPVEIVKDFEQSTELPKTVVAVNTVSIESNVLLTATIPTTDACTVQAVNTNAPSGLSLLAQYDSDNDADSGNEHTNAISDTDSIVEVAISDNKEYRNKVIEINSDTDDASDSNSSTESEDEASQKHYLAKMRKVIEKRMELSDDDDDDDDDDGGKRKKRQPPKVRGEMLLDDLPPIQDLQITVPEDECIELGRIHSIVDQLVLVSVLPNSLLLDLDTVLFLDKGKRVLGEVFDVLGQVADPLYCIRFNTHEQIVAEKSLKVGDVVYVAPKTQYTQFVILSSLMKLRGSDASWENDIEPPPRYVDYSDDEQERAARGRLRNKDRSCERDGNITKMARADSQESLTSEYNNNNNTQRYNQRSYNGRGGRGARGGRGFNSARGQQHARPYNAGDDFNAGSWHSNYYRGPSTSQYRMPPPPMPAAGNYNHSMYAPMPQFNSYPQVPPQHMASQPPPPMYVLNPYAMRPPILPPNQHMPHAYSTSPPAPGSQ